MTLTTPQMLVGALCVDFLIQFLGWTIASAMKTEKFYDALGSLSYLLLSIGSLALGRTFYSRQVLMTCLVVAWTVRLGSFLVLRLKRTGRDSRFDELKFEPLRFLVAWFLQGVWVWVVSLPLLILNSSSENPPLGWTDIVGVLLWTGGFCIESVADWQKFAFKSDLANKGKFIDVGLWKYARYPNYFGEMMLWCGFLLGSSAVFQGADWLATISPLFVIFLLLFVSGIPLQEAQAQQRWGQDPDYQVYRANTSLLLPLPSIFFR